MQNFCSIGRPMMPLLTAGVWHTASAFLKRLGTARVIASLVAGVILLNVVIISVFPRSAVHPGSLLPGLRDSAQQLQRVRASPVFQLLQAAQEKASSTDSSLHHQQQHTQLQLEPHCQLQESDLRGVLTLAASVAAPPTGNSQDTTSRALQLRELFQREWKAVLQPYMASGQHRRPTAAASATASNSSSCRSVGLAPRRAVHAAAEPGQQRQQEAATALLLVLGDWGSLDRMLRLYAINLFTIFSYARLHGYGLELYVHGQPLPAGMPVYFIKVLGLQYLFNTLGYQNALYLDMDTFTSPHSAPPLALLYGESPAASLLLQAEHNMCAATLLWRNTPEGHALLQAWWDVGESGCCPTFPHDQTALKHMLMAYAANITGRPWLYPASMQRRFKLPAHHPLQQQQQQEGRTTFPPSSTDAHAASSTPAVSMATAGTAAATAADPATSIQRPTDKVLSTDYMPHKPSTWLELRPRLQATHSALGFVGVDVFGAAAASASSGKTGSIGTRTVLHNCLGMWWGCVPLKTPALLYHTGHWIMVSLCLERHSGQH
jgi:hypothetical protein